MAVRITLATLLLLCLPAAGAAQEASATPRWALDLSAGTAFPVHLGGGALLEVPGRALVDVRLGVLPAGYVRVINAVAVGFDLYDENDADLIEAAIQRSFILRLGGGWRVGRRTEVMAGYTLVAAGGGLAQEDILGRSVGVDPGEQVDLEATLHMLHASIGGRFVLRDRLVLRVAFEWVHTVAVTATYDLDRPILREQTETYLEDILRRYGFTPALRVELAWRALSR